MKKIYGLTGLIGFSLMIGGAGGADSTSFTTALSVMIAGLALVLLSLALVKNHKLRMRKKRQLYMKKRAVYLAKESSKCAVLKRKTPAGISAIISGTLNSPELC